MPRKKEQAAKRDALRRALQCDPLLENWQLETRGYTRPMIYEVRAELGIEHPTEHVFTWEEKRRMQECVDKISICSKKTRFNPWVKKPIDN